jgi:plasmid stabilization system protein ParE
VTTPGEIRHERVLEVGGRGVGVRPGEPQFAEDPLEPTPGVVARERDARSVRTGVRALGDEAELGADVTVAVDDVRPSVAEPRTVPTLRVHAERVREGVLIGVHSRG